MPSYDIAALRRHLPLTGDVDVGDEVDHAFMAHLADRVDAAAQQLSRRARRVYRSLARPFDFEVDQKREPQRLAKRAAAGGATFSGGRSTMAPLSQAASHK